jgi:hypothetical protein
MPRPLLFLKMFFVDSRAAFLSDRPRESREYRESSRESRVFLRVNGTSVSFFFFFFRQSSEDGGNFCLFSFRLHGCLRRGYSLIISFFFERKKNNNYTGAFAHHDGASRSCPDTSKKLAGRIRSS